MCTICEHYGDDKEATEAGSLYDDAQTVKILLCRTHAVELFKNGQIKFLLNHAKILSSVLDSNHPKFIDLLQSNYKKNKYLL